MPRNWVPCALAVATLVLVAAVPRPASAEFFGCNDQHAVRHVAYNSYNSGSFGPEPAYARHYAQVRPHVTIHPRHQCPALLPFVADERIPGQRTGGGSAHALLVAVTSAGTLRGHAFIRRSGIGGSSMSKLLKGLGVAVLLAATIAATSVPAQARWHGGGGWHGTAAATEAAITAAAVGVGDQASALVSVSAPCGAIPIIMAGRITRAPITAGRPAAGRARACGATTTGPSAASGAAGNCERTSWRGAGA